MSRQEYIAKIEFAILYIAFGFVLLFQYSRSFTNEEIFLFVELIMAYIWTMGLLTYAKIKFKLRIFEPIVIITAIYEGIFVVKPIVDLRAHTMSEHGISVISGGGKATALFMIGYTVFFCSYYITHRRICYNNKPLFHKSKDINFNTDEMPILYAMWIVVYILCIVCMVTQGLSLRYIFSFGTDGVRIVNEDNTALLFLSNFGITLITLWLIIIERSENKLIKIITTLLCIVYILMRNARWLMLVFILAPIVLFYLKRNKEPRLLWLVIVGAAGLTVFAWMQANRASLASGGAMQGWGKDGFSLELLLAPLESDLSTYRTFYSMVKRFPSQYDYLLGKTFLYACILFVPRAIWGGKPDNPVRDMIEHSLNKQARTSGTAVANIGELYANFGIFGIVGGMYLLGRVAYTLKQYALGNNSSEISGSSKQIAYAILLPLLFQWIARGNFSGNIYLTLFAMLPFIVKRFIRFSAGRGR